MKAGLIPNFDKDSRQLVASKIAVIFSIASTGIFAIYNYAVGVYSLFFIDSVLFGSLLLSYFFLNKNKMYLLGKIAMFIMLVGLILIISYDDGKNSTYLWSFTAMFYMMFIFGPKNGAVYTGILLTIIFVMMYKFIDINITSQGYVRFLFVSVTLAGVAFAYEYSIVATLSRLEKVQKELKEMSIKDSLTTLYNRRYFDDIFPKQIKVAKRNSKLLAFAMADIDSFKNYNDTYGHQAGDEVLKAVSLSFLDSMQRADDYVFRLGGEEFGILFFSESKENALNIVNTICSNVKDLKIAHSENSASPYVTVSIGIYVIKPTDNYDYDEIFKMADDAMYGAKQKGKNTVEEL